MNRHITMIRTEKLCSACLSVGMCTAEILRLDYGYDYPLLEIYDVYVSGNRLSGVLYVDGHMDGPVMLERRY